MRITWLQSQMVRLLALKQCADKGPSPSQLWYDESLWPLWISKLPELHQMYFGQVVKQFIATFALSEGETSVLHCLVCMRNMLAHAAVSLYAITEQKNGQGPVLAYVPISARSKSCRKCPGYPQGDESGVTLPFDEQGIKNYFRDVDKVSEALGRIASKMGLNQRDLL